MQRICLLFFFAAMPTLLHAQQIASSYATRDGRAGTVVIACPNSDGSYTAALCSIAKPSPVTYVAPAASAITTANTAVTVFTAGAVLHRLRFRQHGFRNPLFGLHGGRIRRCGNVYSAATWPVLSLPLPAAWRRHRRGLAAAILRRGPLLIHSRAA